MESTVRAARLVSCLALAGALLAVPAAAEAAAPASWGTLAGDIARSWRAQQNRNGTFRDYVYGGHVSFCRRKRCRRGLGNARYAESTLGYAMIKTGLRAHDGRLVNAGLRAIDYIVRRRDLQRRLPTNFESVSVASAYNLARRRLARRPLFSRHRRQWVRWMQHVKPQWIGSSRPYFNHTLVEAVSNLELWRTGLRSRVRGTVLNPKRRPRLRRLTMAVLNRTIPRIAASTTRTARGVRGQLLSDRPDFPLPYHGFSLGFYARAIHLLGPRASSRSRALLARLANASWLLSGPDGDVAYTGRSQEDVWAPAATAYGAEFAAHLPGTGPAAAARFEALADRTVDRIATAYGVGPRGLWVIPALRLDRRRGLRALDRYAGGAAFSGLALMQLEWAIDAAAGARSSGVLAADSQGAARVLRGDDTTALVRSGDLWYAVRQASSFRRFPGDLRWDFGLVALKELRGDTWRDLQPLRPVTRPRPTQSAGPLLELHRRGRTGIPYGVSIGVGRDLATTVRGGFRMPSGRWLRRGVRFRYQPTSCGVRLSFAARRRDSIEYSAFMRGSKRSVQIDAGRVADRRQLVTFSPGGRVTLQGGYSSGADPRLVRARIHFHPAAAATIAVTVCSR